MLASEGQLGEIYSPLHHSISHFTEIIGEDTFQFF